MSHWARAETVVVHVLGLVAWAAGVVGDPRAGLLEQRSGEVDRAGRCWSNFMVSMAASRASLLLGSVAFWMA